VWILDHFHFLCFCGMGDFRRYLTISHSHPLIVPRDAMHKRGLCRHAVSVCLSVCVSVTFVDCVKTNKHIFKIVSPSGSHTILFFFRAKRHSNIPTGTPLMGASNAGEVGRNRYSEPIYGLTACVNAATGRCCKRGRRWSTASVSQVIRHRW